MNFGSTDPLTARSRFKSRSVVCLAALIVIFLGSVWVVSWLASVIYPSLILMLVADVLLLGVCYYLYLQWHDQPIRLCCPECTKIIVSSTPWICGVCDARNTDTDNFPFVHKCRECGVSPKAYRCHHCSKLKLIFLSDDNDATNYAHNLNSPAEAPEADQHVEKIKEFRQTKEAKLAERDLALAEEDLLNVRKRMQLGDESKKSPQEKLEKGVDTFMGLEDAKAALLARYKEECKGDKARFTRKKAALEKAFSRQKLEEL